MRFKDALWDGSDPLYAPGISWSGKNPERRYAQWKCPTKFVKAGYAITKVKIEPAGHVSDRHQPARALRCRELTQEVIRWSETQDKPRVDPDTWMYLIARYRTDEFSPIQEVKANTKIGYLEQMKKLEEVIGHTKIAALTYEVIKTIQKAMTDKGLSLIHISEPTRPY